MPPYTSSNLPTLSTTNKVPPSSLCNRHMSLWRNTSVRKSVNASSPLLSISPSSDASHPLTEYQMRKLYLLGKHIACKARVTTEGSGHLRFIANRRHATYEVRGFHCRSLYTKTDARVSSTCTHRQCVAIGQCKITCYR